MQANRSRSDVWIGCAVVLLLVVFALSSPFTVHASNAAATATPATSATATSPTETPEATQSPASVTIHITGATAPTGFVPALLTVHVGDTVVFLNDASPAATYTVTAKDHSFTSPAIPTGQQWSTTFSTPGVHDYTDPAHTAQMYGQLVVVPTAVQLLPTPQPGAVETAIAQLQPTATPSPTASPTPVPQVTPHTISSTPGLSPLLLIGGVLLLLILATLGVVWFIRSRQASA